MSRNRPPAAAHRFALMIFDCDGVLVDSELLSCRAGVEALAAIGRPVSLEAFAERFVGISDKEVFAALEQDFGGALPEAFKADVARRSALLFAKGLRRIPHVAWALPRLSVRKCVASGSVPEGLEAKLHRAGLYHHFAPALFSAAMVQRGKPAPDLFLHAAARMAAEPKGCLVIEDSRPGVLAAKAAGMTVFGFVGGSHCRPGHGSKLIEAGADLVFDDMRALPNLVATAPLVLDPAGQRKSTPTTS
jgi:HAD superfamily hydrolase (TIGR01509 family)